MTTANDPPPRLCTVTAESGSTESAAGRAVSAVVDPEQVTDITFPLTEHSPKNPSAIPGVDETDSISGAAHAVRVTDENVASGNTGSEPPPPVATYVSWPGSGTRDSPSPHAVTKSDISAPGRPSSCRPAPAASGWP